MHFRTLFAVLVLSLVALGVACAPAESGDDPAAVRAAIEETNTKFAEAFNQGDAAAVAALYDEDAATLPPNATRAQGREAIEKATAAEMERYGTRLSLKTSEVEVSGDFAIEIGAYTAEVEGNQDQGKYLVVWKKQQDGSWKLYRDIWNSDLPLPEDHEEGEEPDEDTDQ